MKIILIVLTVLVLLGLLSAGACVYMYYRAKQKFHQFQNQVTSTFPMPTGTREIHTHPSAPESGPSPSTGQVIDMGVPVYPGANAIGSGSNLNIGTGSIKVQQYETGDSVDQVATFYKEKLGSNAMLTQGGGKALVQLVGSNGMINVSIEPDGGSGKTKISINSISK